MRTGIVTMDGKIVGYIDVSIDEGSDEEFSVNPDRPMHRFPGTNEGVPGRDGFTPGRGRGHGPLFRPHIGPRARPEPREPERRRPTGPTFRPGLRPRGAAPPEAPPHFTTGDVDKAVHGRGRGIDRSKFTQELRDKPGLREKILRIAANEQGSHPEGTQAIIESMMNRAQMRGTSLEREARWTGEGGYYAQGNMGRGALENARHRAILERSLQGALGGSNVSNYATDNASGAFGRGEVESGKFLFRKQIHGEIFTSPGWGERVYRDKNYPEWRAKADATGPPKAVTRLGPDPNYREQDQTPRITSGEQRSDLVQPGADVAGGAETAVGGAPPQAFIMHHTGGRGDAQGVVNTLQQRGLGVQYVMDREGVIHHIGGPGAANIMPESRYRQTPITGKEFLTNRNIVGMEVIASNDRDVTAKQVAAAQAFIAKNYPNTPVFGHGEVNPGHKEADEGRKIVSAIRMQRAAEAAQRAVPVAEAAQKHPHVEIGMPQVRQRVSEGTAAEMANRLLETTTPKP